MPYSRIRRPNRTFIFNPSCVQIVVETHHNSKKYPVQSCGTIYPQSRCHSTIRTPMAKVRKSSFRVLIRRTFLAKCAISLSIRAAKLGHIETLKWIRSKNYIWNEEVCAAAAKSGHSSLLLWLHENDCPWNENTFANAVKNGCLDTLKWLRTTDCPMDEDCFIYAAKNGDMAILEWLKSEKCPWSEDAYIEAIGNMDILAWLNKNGCPWSDRVSLIAARREQWKTLQWLEANGCPMHTNIEMNSSQ